MSRTTIENTYRKLEVTPTGDQGPPGLYWINDPWEAGITYIRNSALLHEGSSWRATVTHVAVDPPGVGPEWEVLALGSDVADVENVLAIADDIQTVAASAGSVGIVAGSVGSVDIVAGLVTQVQTVAARDADIVTVAARDADIVTVAARDADIGTVADVAAEVAAVANVAGNILTVAARDADIEVVAGLVTQVQTVANRDADIAIVAASDTSIRAVADVAGEVALIGENIGDVVTVADEMSAIQAAPQAALNAAASAAIASAARLEDFGVHLFNQDGIEPREFFAERYAPAKFLLTRFYAEVISGDTAAFANMWVELDGVVVYGPFDVSIAGPVMADIEIEMPEGGRLNFVLSAIAGGEIIELYAKAWGRVA